jgi:hypothetical protein
VLSAAPWLAPPKHTPDSGSRETLAEPSSEHSAAAPRRSAIGCQKSFRAIDAFRIDWHRCIRVTST